MYTQRCVRPPVHGADGRLPHFQLVPEVVSFRSAPKARLLIGSRRMYSPDGASCVRGLSKQNFYYKLLFSPWERRRGGGGVLSLETGTK